MKQIKITIEEIIEVPDEVEIELAVTGAPVGIKLSDGRVLKPWLEYFTDNDEEDLKRVSYQELCDLEILTEGPTSKTIEEI